MLDVAAAPCLSPFVGALQWRTALIEVSSGAEIVVQAIDSFFAVV